MTISNFTKLIIILLISQLLLLVLTQFTVWPEMILYPYLMLHGFSLYKEIINPYFPLLSITIFTFFKLFGLSILNLKILTWIIILITDGIIIYIAKLLYQKNVRQVVALAIFIPLQLYFGGNGLWFELVLSPIILLALALVYFYPKDIKKIIVAAILFGLAVLIKQNSLLFLIPISLWFVSQRLFRNIILFLIIVVTFLAISFGLITRFGLWSDFLIWAIKLPLTFSRQHGFVLLPAIRQYPLILFPLLSVIPLLLSRKYKTGQKLFWGLSFLVALQFVFPRYENFHLQVLVGLSSLFVPMLPRKYLLGFFGLSLILFSLFFLKNFHQPDRFIDSSMLELSEKIKNYPSVYILNGADLSYYFADKLPPKPWAINFPWYFEVNNFENKFINSIETEKTAYIIIGDPLGGDKYGLGNYLPAGLIEYIAYNYSQVEKFQNYTIWQRRLNSP